MEQHVILCGLGLVGSRVLAILQGAGIPVVVIDNASRPGDPRLGDAVLVAGDCRLAETLQAADVDKAKGVLIMTSSDLVNLSTTLMVRTLNPKVRIVCRMFNQQLVQRLGEAAQNVVALSTSALTAPVIGLMARTGQALGTFQTEGGERYHVTEIKLDATSPLLATTLKQFTDRFKVQVLAHIPAADAKPRFITEVDPQAVLAAGDVVVLLCEGSRLDALLAEVDPGSQGNLAWASAVRRGVRMVGRTLNEVDLGVKICTSVFVGVILTSTLVFTFGMKNDTLPDAFYRTVSLIATGADMGGRDVEPGTWQKVFISILRVVGATLTAAFTAILTNYLVRAQLGGVLEVRRIPDSGHFIVCGLGNVGYRVVQELLAEQEKIVVVEQSRDSPFIPTARRLGAAVIVGDATVAQVLKQANAGGSRAVVAVTSNDLVNLEIALQVREIKPAHRVVLRLGDPNLARTLREAANVRLALSIPDLAAPAFVAALYGDRVRSVFFVAGKLLAVVDLVAIARGALDGQPVRALAVDYQLMPLGLTGADGVARQNLLNARLAAGDRLTCLLSLSDMKRLLRRDPGPRVFGVEVQSVPLPARWLLVKMLKADAGLDDDQAMQAHEKLPLRLKKSLTRGQAEDYQYQLQREGMTAEVFLDQDAGL